MDLIAVYTNGATTALALHASRAEGFNPEAPGIWEKMETSLRRLLVGRYQTQVVEPLRDLVAAGSHDDLLKQWLNTECNYVAMLVLMDVGAIPKTNAYTEAFAALQAN